MNNHAEPSERAARVNYVWGVPQAMWTEFFAALDSAGAPVRVERNRKLVADGHVRSLECGDRALDVELGRDGREARDEVTIPDCRAVHVCRHNEALRSIHVLSDEPATYALRFGTGE